MSNPRNEPAIRAMTDREHNYVIKSWCEALHRDHHSRTPWKVYKPFVLPGLRRVIESSTVLVSMDEDVIAGWIAFERRSRVSALHWIHTRYKHPSTGELMRRRGIAAALLDAAQIGSHFVYTHQSSLSSQIVNEVAERDIIALYVPYPTWKNQ